MADSSPQPGQPSVNVRPLGGAFVGRQREMAELRSALDDAIADQGRIVMLAGEPGIGKTRTARELSAQAEQRGAQVFWGWCYEDGDAPPYWPWLQPIRSYVQQVETERLRSEMGAGAADIAEVLHEVSSKLPGLPKPPALEPEQARFRLFDSITNFFKTAAQSRPLVIVLDDLQWSDRSSLRLLEFLAKEITSSRLLLVDTYRDVEVSERHPLSQTLGALMRESSVGGFQRVQLGGFNQQEVGEFVEASTGVVLSQETRELLHGRTEGNPLFVGEVTQQIDAEDLTASGAWANTIPEGIRDAISRRLDRLSEQCNEVLTIASVIGRDFDFRLLNLLSGEVSEDQLLQAVDEAVSFHLIEDAPGQMDRYQFSHALIQQTLSEAVTTSRKVRLHARIGEALEDLYGAGAEAHASELVRHFAEAETVLGIEKMVSYSLLAGENALAAYAWEEALEQFQRGLEARQISLTRPDPAADLETAKLLFGLGRVQSATLQREALHEATATLKRTFDYFAKIQDVASAVAIAEQHLPPMTGQNSDIPNIVSQALDLVSPNSHESARLWCTYGRWMGLEGAKYQESKASFERAMVLAKSQGDLDLEMRTYAATAQVEAFHLHLQECLDNSLKATEMASKVDNPMAECVGSWFVAFSMITMGETAQVDRALEANLDSAQRLRDRYWVDTAYTGYAGLSLLRGDWDACFDYCQRYMGVGSSTSRSLMLKAILEHQLGNFELGDVSLNALLELTRSSTPGPSLVYVSPVIAIPAAARISGSLEWFDMVEERAKTALSSPTCTPFTANFARCGLGLMAVQQNDAAIAQEIYRELVPYQGTVPHTGHIAVDRLLGLLSHTMGNLTQAKSHFGDALMFCRKAGYRSELAWSCCDFAGMLLERKNEGDQAKANALLDESLAISTELGMLPLKQRVTNRLERDRAQPETAPAYPGGLTQREVEVLRLIASGKTDREIAEELFIGVRTVSTHVGNILNKTNAANCAEAASYANQQCLV